MVDLGESSGLAKGLVAFPLACLSCFALYHFGMGFGVDRAIKISANVTIGVDESKPRLRSNNESKPQLRSSNESFSSKFLESIGVDLPHCALDVFLTLHKEIGGEDEHQCKALLISDDILLTSRVCSKFKFTFELPAFGTVEAVPHTSLNSKEEMVGSRLGLLEARNPMYAHFVDMPSRRTPMFLSYRSNPVVNGTDPRAPVFLTCGDKNEPIAHNFPVDGEMVPLHELAGVVPDDILWEEIDIYTAPMLRYKSHRWWTKPVTLEEEDEAIRKMISHYRGPPGSISVPDAHPSYESAASALFEVVDPRGHRNQDCFKLYFLRYRFESPFSRMHFFDWLDFGNGKFLLEIDQMNGKSNPMIKKKKLSACLKKNFNHKTVHYFNEEERLKHKIYISPSEDGSELIARYKANNELVPESEEGEPHLYMWDLNQTFYVVDDSWNKEKYGRIKHTAVLDGGPALSAGKVYFGEHGKIWGINYSSGHYRPDIQAAAMMYHSFKNKGFNVSALHWVGRTSWSTQTCNSTDWESIDIDGFEASELSKACSEVTTSPTWILKDDV